MVIFDIDQTILDASQRYKDARRAGYIDKDGNAKRKRTLETPNKARKRANEFLFSPENLRKDKVIPGALALANHLAAQGHIIAYVTARHSDYRDVTRNQLEDKGFPLFKDDTDMELLFLKANRGEATPKYKGDAYAQLNSRYDVRMVFDDMKENLQAAVSQGITGVYASVSDYTRYQVKSNPWYHGSDGAAYFVPDYDDMKYGGTGGMDPDADPYDSAASHADESGMGRVPLTNPPVKPRRKKMKNGKYRKEPAKKYVDRFMGDSKMNKEFPDRGQRYAVCLRYVEKFYGKSGLKSVGARPNPAEEYSEDYMVPRDIHRLGKAADSLESTYDEQDVPEWWKSKLSVAAKDADTLADALDYVAENPGHSLNEDFERMKQMAYDVRTREMAGEPINGREWWNQQSSWIEGRYGTEPLDVSWAMPLETDGFDPYDKSKEFDQDGKVLPLHFLNQLKRIPMIKEPTPERIMQIALNIGQGQASGSVETDFTLDDFIIRQNPMPLMGLSVQVSGYRNAAGAFVMKGKKFLILQRSKKETSKHGLWELPGGKVEKGETPREAAVIETKEEAGLDIKLKVNLGPHHDDKKKKTYHAYVGVPKKGQKVKLSEEHSAHKWVTAEEVLAMPKKMVSHHLLYFLKKDGDSVKDNPNPLSWIRGVFAGPKTWVYEDDLGTMVTVVKGEGTNINGTPKDSNTQADTKGKKPFHITYHGVNLPTKATITMPDGHIEEHTGLIKEARIEPKTGYTYVRQADAIDRHSYLNSKALLTDSIEERDQIYADMNAIADARLDDLVDSTPEVDDIALDELNEMYAKYGIAPSKENPSKPRSNPPKKKIEKGKKLYKHMNGKEPENIQTKKIDIGDVWYQVGEGGCWQIGYMSGKETGQSEQKYTHTFNEETKDGNFPKLYATMPENGKPMLIITGGTWKIRTDDKGVAWIYD